MMSQTQVFARPRHQFMPNWMPRNRHGQRTFVQQQTPAGSVNIRSQPIEFDGKRLRKAVSRRTVDYNASVCEWVQSRLWQRDHHDMPAIQPDQAYQLKMLPPGGFVNNSANAVTTKFVRAATNKMKCPVFCVTWTPEGRRLITGASSGEFTLWNGLTFNFETILQAHDLPVRCMTWSKSDQYMVTGDHGGYIKYWQTNMNNVRMFQGHKEAVRGISFCPTDTKFTSCSDDGTVRVWDFQQCHEERILRGHGSDVKCVEWHPQKSLVVSGSKDSQQPIKLWCPRSGQSLATIHAHKSTVMDVKWNRNGNWLLSASRDHLIKIFDIRKLNVEMQTFRGHKREACTLAWHPVHEGMFASGGSDGSVMFWMVGTEKEIGAMEQAHDSCVWSLAWHPVGHILCTGSNDHSSKFWTRNRPGDKMRDRYNLNTLPRGADDLDDECQDHDGDRDSVMDPHIPGMGIDAEQLEKLREGAIPGLDDDKPQRKTPHNKPIHKGFQQQWLEKRAPVGFQEGDNEDQDQRLPPPGNNNNHPMNEYGQAGNPMHMGGIAHAGGPPHGGPGQMMQGWMDNRQPPPFMVCPPGGFMRGPPPRMGPQGFMNQPQSGRPPFGHRPPMDGNWGPPRPEGNWHQPNDQNRNGEWVRGGGSMQFGGQMSQGGPTQPRGPPMGNWQNEASGVGPMWRARGPRSGLRPRGPMG